MPPRADPFYIALGQRVRKYRDQRKLTQEQLGDRLTPQMTRAAIANIEAGKQRVLAHTLVQLAENLGVTVEDLVAAKPTASATPISDQVVGELRDKLRLPSRQVQQLTRQLGLIGALERKRSVR